MDADQIRQLRPKLSRYLNRFASCFTRTETRGHMRTYVEGQLSDLSEKSCEPIALAAGMRPRTLQEFLTSYRWDEDRTRDCLQRMVGDEQAGPHTIAIIDETSDVKKGDKTPGVKRQWCGTVGKKENCIVTVHLGYAQGDFHCLLDGELFLPEDWAADRKRCQEAGIPDDVAYRPKWQIALALYDRARGNGVSFDWLACDEGYGSKPEFLRQLDDRGQVFVAEVPTSLVGWLNPPKVTSRPYRRGRGRGRRRPRLVAGSRKALSVGDLLKYSSALRDKKWVKYRVKEGSKGPMVWEVKHARITVKDENGLPGRRYHLVVARNVLDPDEVKFFISNAPPETKVTTLLLVAFSRWRVERCFQDQKQEVGLDQWEGRRWLGLKRHLILTAVSYLFLARVREQLRGEKSGVNSVPSAYGRESLSEELVVSGPSIAGGDRAHGEGDSTLAATQRRESREPHEANTQETAEQGHFSERCNTLHMA